ncbi:MAG: tetratricopeptide repeat protein, partial [Myxococcota bacterium]
LVAWERGDMVRAERYYARAADLSLMRSRNLDPTWADPSHRNYLRALEGRALCLYQLGRFEEAIELFELLGHTSVPDYQGCYYLAGEIYHLTGRLKRAIDCYTRAPVEPSVLYNLALAYYQLDDLERAATAFIRAFASNRFLADALLSRAPTASSPFTGYLSSPMYAEEFLQACRPLWRSASECLEFMERCYDHPLVQHQLWSVAAGQELTTDSLHGELLPDTKELQRVHSIAQRVLAGLVA